MITQLRIQLALFLKKYSSRYHGALGLAWFNQIVANRQTISRYISDTIQTFVDAVIHPDATGQIIRVARCQIDGDIINLLGDRVLDELETKDITEALDKIVK